eukprot:1159936-Pelagomonas_calceolata.AAC.1
MGRGQNQRKALPDGTLCGVLPDWLTYQVFNQDYQSWTNVAQQHIQHNTFKGMSLKPYLLSLATHKPTFVSTDATAKYQANQANGSVADTGIPASTSTAYAPNAKITYPPNLQNALESHMHTKHRFGYANHNTGYCSYSEFATAC